MCSETHMHALRVDCCLLAIAASKYERAPRFESSPRVTRVLCESSGWGGEGEPPEKIAGALPQDFMASENRRSAAAPGMRRCAEDGDREAGGDRGPADLCRRENRNSRGRNEMAGQSKPLAYRAIRRVVIGGIFVLFARRGEKTGISGYRLGSRVNGRAEIGEYLGAVYMRLREAILESERNHKKINEEGSPRRNLHRPLACDCHNSEASIHGRYSHLGALCGISLRR